MLLSTIYRESKQVYAPSLYYRRLRSNNNYFLYPLHVYVEFIYSIFSIGFLFRGKASSPNNHHTVSTATPLYYLKFPPRPILFFSKPPPFFITIFIEDKYKIKT